MCQGVSRTDSSHMYRLIVMYPQFQCSCPIVQMRDKTSHMGKVMTQVIIKQLTQCMNAPLHVCHSFPFCLPLCLPHSQSFSLAVCWYTLLQVYIVTEMHCTAQPRRASISPLCYNSKHSTHSNQEAYKGKYCRSCHMDHDQQFIVSQHWQ